MNQTGYNADVIIYIRQNEEISGSRIQGNSLKFKKIIQIKLKHFFKIFSYKSENELFIF